MATESSRIARVARAVVGSPHDLLYVGWGGFGGAMSFTLAS